MRDRDGGAALAMILATTALTAAQPSPEIGLRALWTADARVTRIAWRLTTTNLPLCPRRNASIGILLHRATDYDGWLRSAAVRMAGLDRGAVVLAVAQGSPAAAADIRVGDAVTAIGGVPAPAEVATGRLEAALTHGPTDLRLLRDGTTVERRVKPVTACASAVELDTNPVANAGADGDTISVSTILEAQLSSDDQLAFVIAHELAHNAAGHRAALLTERRLHGGPAARRLAAIHEREADRIGLFMVARAGFDTRLAAGFWAGTGRRIDRSLIRDAFHGDWRTRADAALATVDEIEKLNRAGRPLIPPASQAAAALACRVFGNGIVLQRSKPALASCGVRQSTAS